MLTPTLKSSFTLQSKLFGFLPSQIMEWNTNQTQIVVKPIGLKKYVGHVLRLNIFLQSICYGVQLAHAVISTPFIKLDFAYVFFVTVCFYAFLVGVVVEQSILMKNGRVLNNLNVIFQLNINLTQAKYVRTIKKWDVYGFCSILSVITATLLPFVYTGGAIFMDYDSTLPLLDMVLPDSRQRSMTIILLALTTRTFIQILASLEFSRSGSFTACLLLALAHESTQIMNSLWDISFLKFKNIYGSLSILYSKSRLWLNCMLHAVHSGLFWGTVLSIWFVVRCWGKVDFFVYNGAVIIMVSILTVQVLLLPESVIMLGSLHDVVFWQKQKIRFYHVRLKLRSTFWNLKVANGIRPIVFWYGQFFVVDKEFLTSHAMLLMDRVVDSLVISDLG